MTLDEALATIRHTHSTAAEVAEALTVICEEVGRLSERVQALEDGPVPDSYGPSCTCCRACNR